MVDVGVLTGEDAADDEGVELAVVVGVLFDVFVVGVVVVVVVVAGVLSRPNAFLCSCRCFSS
mgnify:CR=1 FL=1